MRQVITVPYPAVRGTLFQNRRIKIQVITFQILVNKYSPTSCTLFKEAWVVHFPGDQPSAERTFWCKPRTHPAQGEAWKAARAGRSARAAVLRGPVQACPCTIQLNFKGCRPAWEGARPSPDVARAWKPSGKRGDDIFLCAGGPASARPRDNSHSHSPLQRLRQRPLLLAAQLRQASSMGGLQCHQW